MITLTKDELRIILLDMDINIFKAPPLKPSPIYLALREKIQFMIDNYCEHELEDWALMDNNAKICIKCEEMIIE